MKTAIEVKNLKFNYEKNKPILKNISFEIEKSSITAILGKNGSGKSTLLDCIINYHDFKIGNIYVNGGNIKKLSLKELAKRISYIPQNTITNMDFSVQEFISFGRNCHLEFPHSLSEKDYKIIEQCAERCKIKHLLDKNINKLSGGERQLVFIARALAQESPIIIMDEPASALDFGNQARLLNMIKELQNEGKTIIFTTHNPNQAKELNCNVIAINNGEIIKSGFANEIISSELIKEIYGDDLTISEKSYLIPECYTIF